ncbi:MAG: hypothetical protein IRY99_09825 [Isosphaeraceae bacterium]|nr:hypothetical protein [Isosphaeraceae bacterium]
MDRPRGRQRLIRLLGLALGITAAIVALWVLPLWGAALVPPGGLRRATVVLLWGLLIAYGLILAIAPAGTILLGVGLWRARRRGESWPVSRVRALLLCASLLVGLALLEGGAAAWRAWTRRPPALPTSFADDPKETPKRTPDLPTRFREAPQDELNLVVIGESSARGEPYDPRLSVGQIVGWQLGHVFPERRVRVQMLAKSGCRLEEAIQSLAALRRRPDAILLYSGHNEFQARYALARSVRHYRDEFPKPRRDLRALAARSSPVGALIDETLERNQLALPPPPRSPRALVDVPTCTPEEYESIRSEFHRGLEQFITYCTRIGALPIGVIPPGNEGGFEPNRSVLAPETTAAERAAAAEALRAARAAEADDPTRALSLYRRLLARHPEFAEAHFRLARLLEVAGDWPQARHHYARARDLDGLPMRCPGDLQDAYRRLAARHSGFLVVDGPAVLQALSPHGIVDDHLLHDGQHPTLRGYLALAQDLLNQLAARRAFGWPAGRPAPTIDPDECAAHFGLDRGVWADVCERSALFYDATALIRYDPSERSAKARRYRGAAARIAAGELPELAGVPGLGVHPAGLRELEAGRTTGAGSALPLTEEPPGAIRIPDSKFRRPDSEDRESPTQFSIWNLEPGIGPLESGIPTGDPQRAR